ncbi:MAG: penicillin-binding transpeptidase domain-containing protein [Acetivibrio sp.]
MQNYKNNDKRNETKRFTSKMQASLLFIFCMVILIFLVLVGRMLYLTNKDGEKYEKRVLSQQTYVSNPIPYKRGEILDRNMTKLAVSEKVYNLILDPVAMLQKESYPKATKKALKECFGIEENEIDTILKEKSQSQYVQMKDYKRMEYETVELFHHMEKKEKNIQGVWFEEEYIRKYPLSTVGSTVIGFTQKADNNIGNWGMEEAYNDELSGTNGREFGYFNEDMKLERTVKPAINGNNIISTIDANVQKAVERKVKAYLKEPGAKNAAVILMNPKNGEIYAMVSNKAFDLNNPRDLSDFYTKKEITAMTDKEMSAALSAIWRNYCISDAYEPGSTFKPFTIAAALDEGVINEKSTFTCNGYAQIADKRISCNVKAGHGTIDVRKSLMVSCNAALMQIGTKLGKEKFSLYNQLFGFGEKTGIDLPGESSGIFYGKENLNPVELATSSFGQSNTVNMIQMVSAFSSLINGGNYYTPHIVKEIQNEKGATVKKTEETLVKKTISNATSDKIRDYLFATVEEGTAAPAKVLGYEIGGKTGTAEKLPRDKTNYIVSFLGFAPAKDPEVVIYVVIDQPNVKDQPHSTFATVFASEVMNEVLPFLGIYPDTNIETKDKTKDKTRE